MSKLSVKVREIKRMRMVIRYANKRSKFKTEKEYTKLDKLPKNSSSVRLSNRCRITGRKRGYMRKFGISRIVFRQWASIGKIPGIKKVSW